MELIMIELLLWAGLIFFFWALKDGLSHVEADIEELGVFNDKPESQGAKAAEFVRPDQVIDPIGRYQDAPIYQYAVIGGQYYRFDRVCPAGTGISAHEHERYVAPGLIYVPVAEREQPAF
ncbi:MAG TPA: hypothetical protein VEC06_16515 [Paucimonas sp.]|nr:hypothetical protein [Paucimonas sp.]